MSYARGVSREKISREETESRRYLFSIDISSRGAHGNKSQLVNPSAHLSLCNQTLKMGRINRGHVGYNVPPCITNLYGPLRVRTPTTTSEARGDEERDAITRQNAERWKREMFLRREELPLRPPVPPPSPLRPPSPPPLPPQRGAFLSISFSSLLFFRVLRDALPAILSSAPVAVSASFRDYILEIVNRMPADDAPADIPYISGDPFFVHEGKTRAAEDRAEMIQRPWRESSEVPI